MACNAQIAGTYFSQGWNQRMSPLDYEMMMYERTYGVRATPNTGGGGGPVGPVNGVCSLGQMQCFNGYVRRCEVMPNGAATWWVTSGRSCGQRGRPVSFRVWAVQKRGPGRRARPR